MALDLDGRRVLVTGASSGIGPAIARAAHARGATIVLTARRAELLDGLREELGERAEALPADLADRADVSALLGRAGEVDVLIANAGVSAAGPFETFSAARIDATLEVNLRAPLQLARALMPPMVARGSGALAFVSSLSGKVASPGSSLYSATKFGLRGFALGLHEDLAGTGVGVTCVFPGFVRDAGMFHDSGAKLPAWIGMPTPREVGEATVSGIERGRLEVDVAPIALRLGAKAGGLAPAPVGFIQRKLGGAAVADSLASGRRER